MVDIIKFSEDKKQVTVTISQTYGLPETSKRPSFSPYKASPELVHNAVLRMLQHCGAELTIILLHDDVVRCADMIYSNAARRCFNIRTYEWLEDFSRRSCINLNDLDTQDKLMARKALILYGDRSNIEKFKATLRALE